MGASDVLKTITGISKSNENQNNNVGNFSTPNQNFQQPMPLQPEFNSYQKKVIQYKNNGAEQEVIPQQPVYQQPLQNGMQQQQMYHQTLQNGVPQQPIYQQPLQNGMQQQPMYQQPLQNGMQQQPMYQQPLQNGMQQQPMHQQPVYQQQDILDYQRRLIEEKNSGYNKPMFNQNISVPRPRQQHRRRQIPLEFDNGRLYQQNLDFNNPEMIDYGNFQEINQLERMNSDFAHYTEERMNQYQGKPRQDMVNQQYYNQNNGNINNYPVKANYNQNYQNPIDYNQYLDEPNYYPQAAAGNYYNEHEAYVNQLDKRKVSLLPSEIAREVRSEKLRVSILMLVGTLGIVMMSICIAAHYYIKAHGENSSFAGFTMSQVPYPFVSIVFLIISLLLFSMGATDYSLLYANVKKYERDLMAGKETIPYFITRNYRGIVSRGVYITWIAFATYIIGSIVLGILYGLQAIYEKGGGFYFFFWKVEFSSNFSADITTNLIVLVLTLLAHISNIVWSRSRKNNIIAYYGTTIISADEERQIKKRANKICIIILLVFILIFLFVAVIPWIIVRRKNHKSIVPFVKKPE